MNDATTHSTYTVGNLPDKRMDQLRRLDAIEAELKLIKLTIEERKSKCGPQKESDWKSTANYFKANPI